MKLAIALSCIVAVLIAALWLGQQREQPQPEQGRPAYTPEEREMRKQRREAALERAKGRPATSTNIDALWARQYYLQEMNGNSRWTVRGSGPNKRTLHVHFHQREVRRMIPHQSCRSILRQMDDSRTLQSLGFRTVVLGSKRCAV